MNSVIVFFFIGVAGCVSTVALAVFARLHATRLQHELVDRLNLLPSLSELKEAEGRIAGVRSELDSMQLRLGEAQRIVAEADVAKVELAETRRQLEQLEPKRVEFRSLEERLSQARSAVEQLERELAAIRSERTQAESDVASLRGRLEQLQSEFREAEQALQRLKAELAAAQNAKAEADRTIQSLQARICELSEERDRLTQQVSAVGGQLAQANAELQELQRRIAEAKRDLEAARSEERGCRERSERLQGEMRALEQKRDRAQQELDGARAKLAEIGQPISSERRFAAVFEQPPLKGEAESQALTEAAAIKRVADHASACGFVYSDRVIKAFHTSLKIDSKAPLMVLAGISGTGKTQLPRLYSDALGVHFLPVAVQPGWDSPQDLLGFFSHLEGRFRPTTLLQALVQLDEYMGKSALDREDLKDLKKRWEELQCSDQMLLVLLDEMNLARVEYYFSDFLSRLEIRNSPGFDASDSVKRARASVLLEGGPGSEGIPVFVGHNVLFVGTMNEDESTQSLSDKVVDRANVLRFGTPRKLQAAVARGAAAHDLRGRHLSARTWHSWKTTVKPDSLTVGGRALSEWVADLNNALRSVNRPFGHRTAGAIAEYVGQYPEAQRNDALAKFALADQIEQRVMPKLRGLDPQVSECKQLFEGLKTTVSSLGDDALREAIERGERAHEGAQFVWFGVDRGA